MNNTSMEYQSLKYLGDQFPKHLTWTIVSPIPIFFNVSIVVVIFKCKSLHNKSQYLIMAESVAEIFYSSAFFYVGFSRYLSYARNQPEILNQLECILKFLPLQVLIKLVQILLMAVAFDRFLGIFVAVRYKMASASAYVSSVISICLLFTLARVPFSFSGYDNEKILPICSVTTAYDAKFLNYGNKEGTALAIMIALIYATIAISMLQKYLCEKSKNGFQKSSWMKKIELDVFMSIMIIGTVYLLTLGAANLANALYTAYGMKGQEVMIQTVVSMFSFVSSTSHLFIYLKLNETFRKEFTKTFFKCNRGHIQPAN